MDQFPIDDDLQYIDNELREIDEMLLDIYKTHFEYSISKEDKRDKFIIMINGIKKAIKYGEYNYLTKWFVNFTIFAVESKQPLASIISERILFYISHILLTKITVVAITHFELLSYIDAPQHYDSITSIIEYNTSILSLMLVYMNEYKLSDKQKFNGFAALNELGTVGIDKLCIMVNTSQICTNPSCNMTLTAAQSALIDLRSGDSTGSTAEARSASERVNGVMSCNTGLYSPIMLILIMDPTSIFKNSIYTVKSMTLDVFKKKYCDYNHFKIAYSVLLSDIKRLRMVREQKHPRCCTTCASKLKLLICKCCKSAYYCNKECQKSDWNIHRKNCISKKKLYNNVVKFVQSLVYPSQSTIL